MPDICQESDYMCKLPELPPGTYKGLLHFVEYIEVHKVIRYNFSEIISTYIRKKYPE